MLPAFHIEPVPTANFFGAGLALHAVTEITVNGCRQPPHAADVRMQTLHVELLPPANCFSATDIVTKMAADLPFEIAANDRMQSPHEADRWLQAFHEEGLCPAIFSCAPDIVTEMAADPSFLLVDNGKIHGNCH